MRRTSLAGLEIFLAIARAGSIRGGAAALGLGAPAVSHQLKKLEEAIGVTLFSRTTRSLELTEAGRTLLEGAEPAFGELAAALEAARGTGRARKGALRITLPWSAYRIVLAPHLAEFQAAYPDIRLELSFDEALVDIVAGGFHAGIRLGDRLSPGMIATRLTPPLKGAYSASPAYLDAHGRPAHPRDLLSHRAIRYRFISTNRIADWPFVEDGREFAVDPPAALVFDSFQAVVQAAIAGHGIGWSLRAVVAEELAAGRLETVLGAYTPEHPPFFLYYTEQNRRLELLRVLIDFLRDRRG